MAAPSHNWSSLPTYVIFPSEFDVVTRTWRCTENSIWMYFPPPANIQCPVCSKSHLDVGVRNARTPRDVFCQPAQSHTQPLNGLPSTPIRGLKVQFDNNIVWFTALGPYRVNVLLIIGTPYLLFSYQATQVAVWAWRFTLDGISFFCARTFQVMGM